MRKKHIEYWKISSQILQVTSFYDESHVGVQERCDQLETALSRVSGALPRLSSEILRHSVKSPDLIIYSLDISLKDMELL